MNCNLSRTFAATSLLLLSSFLLWAQASTTTTTTVSAPLTASQAARAEARHRRELAESAHQAVIDGQKLLTVEHFDEAADRFQYVLSAVTPGGESSGDYAAAEAGLAAAKAGQSRPLAAQGKFAQAASLLQEAIALQPNNPVYTQDLEDLKQQQIVYEEQVHNPEGTVNNPAVTEDFKDKVGAVQKLLFQGQRYFETGQYERAETTFSKILILDPYNKAARDAMDHMERYRYRAANLRREEYKDETMLKVDQEWSEAISPDIVVPPSATESVSEPSRRAEITSKLNSIVIDKIDFDKLDVAAVVAFLTEKSRDLDPDHVGINFVLNLNTEATPPSSSTPTATTPSGATTSADASSPSTAAPAAGAAPAATDADAAPATPIHRLVTIQLQNVPLSDVLGYIIQQTNLQYSVDDYAVYLRPSIDEGQTLSVRTFLAPPNFFTSSGGLRVSASTSTDQPTSVENVESDVTQELKNRGIHFPPGATAVFLPGSSKLVVRDTPEQLDLISNLIEQLSKETPQVQIEAKIAEFTQSALNSLSFNYILGFHNILDGQNTTGQGFLAQTNLRDANYANGGVSTGGLQADSIDTLVQANTANSSGLPPTTYTSTGLTVQPNTPNLFTAGAVIDGIGFAAVINALKNNTGVDLISAPTVTTQDNLQANIDIVREFPYPTSFEKPQLSTADIAYSSGKFGPGFTTTTTTPLGTIIVIGAPPLQLAIPPTPREFVTQDIGVSLEVKPTTYPDQRIDLDITKAQVEDFDGFIDYGEPIVTRLSAENPPGGSDHRYDQSAGVQHSLHGHPSADPRRPDRGARWPASRGHPGYQRQGARPGRSAHPRPSFPKQGFAADEEKPAHLHHRPARQVQWQATIHSQPRGGTRGRGEAART